MDLRDKTCLVTGGTKGIGAATAIALAHQGAHVAINARNDSEEAQRTLEEIKATGQRCKLILADCSKPEEITRCVAETTSQLGTVDVLVHSAGGPENGGLFDLTPEKWHSAFDIHLHAIFHLCREVIPAMQKKQSGAIMLISSAAGLRGIPTNLAYQVVKGALPQFTRALAREFANDNIRVNGVAPGVIRTAFHAPMTEEQKQFNLEHRIPLRREGTAEQVADIITSLLQNDYITGETVTIDGGLTMRIA